MTYHEESSDFDLISAVVKVNQEIDAEDILNSMRVTLKEEGKNVLEELKNKNIDLSDSYDVLFNKIEQMPNTSDLVRCFFAKESIKKHERLQRLDYSHDKKDIKEKCCDIKFLITFPFFIMLFLESQPILSMNILLLYLRSWVDCYIDHLEDRRKDNAEKSSKWLNKKCNKINEIINKLDNEGNWIYIRNNSFLTHGGFPLYTTKLSQMEKEEIIKEMINCWNYIKNEVISFIDKKKDEIPKEGEENSDT